jgi:hypothetical protein
MSETDITPLCRSPAGVDGEVAAHDGRLLFGVVERPEDNVVVE